MKDLVVICTILVISFKTSESSNNLAVGKQTRQSTTFHMGPEYAVNGDSTTKVAGVFNCAHTNISFSSWWVVDLGDVYSVSNILVYGRTDCCYDFLQNFDVEVLMPSGCSCDKWATFQGGRTINCHYQQDSTTFLDIKCPNNTIGRFVQIQRRDYNYLVLCEVEVYGQLLSPVVTAPPPNTFKACGYNGQSYSGTLIRKVVARSKLECVMFCRQTDQCCAAEFSVVKQECTLKSKADSMDETTHSLLQDPNTITYLM